MPSARLSGLWPEFVTSPYETRTVEYKGAETWANLRHAVARAALGLCNLRGGGFVVIGVATVENDRLESTGLSAEQLATYRHDEVHEFISNFAQAGMSLRGEAMRHDGRDYYVVEVHQFEKTPAISRKDSPIEHQARGVKKDTIYVRTRGKVETRAASAEDLAELIDLAVDIGVRQYVERAARTGLVLGEGGASDDESYDGQRGGL